MVLEQQSSSGVPPFHVIADDIVARSHVPDITDTQAFASWVRGMSMPQQYLGYLLSIYRHDPEFEIRDTLVRNDETRLEGEPECVQELDVEQKSIAAALYPDMRALYGLAMTSNNSMIAYSPSGDEDVALARIMGVARNLSFREEIHTAHDGSINHIFKSDHHSQIIVADLRSASKGGGVIRNHSQMHFKLVLSGGAGRQPGQNPTHLEEMMRFLREVLFVAQHATISFISMPSATISS